MRKAALLYNPDSGSTKQRQQTLEEALAILVNAGIDARVLPTHSPDHANDEAQRAIDDGCDTIFACGGDGTIHNIVQTLAMSQVALAVLPMGTANCLAHDLGLPLNPQAAAKAALSGVLRRVALGRIRYLDFDGNICSRYFVIAAGIGVDAHLFYNLHTGTKRRMGMSAYYVKAWHLWFSYHMTRFVARYQEFSGAPQSAEVTELMAIRIRNFGGVLQELAPGASLDRNDMRLVFCRTSSRLAYLAYVTRGLLRLRWSIPGIDLANGRSVSCEYKTPIAIEQKIYAEADGELLGTLPAEITIVPDALTILAPKR
jgi:YegS/Rv2252/BmrU family lipid kinase